MIQPEFLKRGDKIAIVSTARKISEQELKSAIDKLIEWGLELVFHENIFAVQDQFAGTDEQRVAALQSALDDDSVKAVLCARGGYGTIRIMEKLNFNRFKNNSKWLIGYSDVTVLHSYFHKQLISATIHATMPVNFPLDGIENESLQTLKKAIFGENIEYKIQSESLNRKGNTEGVLVGGNLSILYSLRGTAMDIDTDDKILFIEDLDEYLYHIDRMMMNLKIGGKLKKLKGLIVGYMSEMKDNTVPFGKTAYEIIYDAVKEYHYPVCFGFPAGHMQPNNALILGCNTVLNVDENGTVLTQIISD